MSEHITVIINLIGLFILVPLLFMQIATMAEMIRDHGRIIRIAGSSGFLCTMIIVFIWGLFK